MLDCKSQDKEFKEMEQHYSHAKEFIHTVAKEALGYYGKNKRENLLVERGGRNIHQ